MAEVKRNPKAFMTSKMAKDIKHHQTGAVVREASRKMAERGSITEEALRGVIVEDASNVFGSLQMVQVLL